MRNTGHGKLVDIWSTDMIASTRMHKRSTSSLLSFCTVITTYVLLCGYPPFRADSTTAQEALRNPWLTANTTNTPSNVDFLK